MTLLLTSIWFQLAACSTTKLPTTSVNVGTIPVTVELATNDQERSEGLMHRESLGTDAGMLFLYPDSKPRAFWMKNTTLPLSIAFLDPSGKIVKIARMQPLSTARTKSIYPAKYALEMDQGWFEAHGIKEGDRVTKIPKDIELDVK